MLRSHTCGELRISNAGETVTLCGWVQRVRDKGGLIWIDLRDKYGITQLLFEEGSTSSELINAATSLGREFVIKVSGEVVERVSKNDKIPTGDIEIRVTALDVLNKAKTPPFTIEDDTNPEEAVAAPSHDAGNTKVPGPTDIHRSGNPRSYQINSRRGT